jgi:hypothetical protein
MNSPGQRIRLRGLIEDGKTVVITNDGAAEALKAVAQDSSSGVGFSAPDAVVLARDAATPDCGCAGATAAAAIGEMSDNNSSYRDQLSDRLKQAGQAQEGGLACSAIALRDMPQVSGEVLFVDGVKLEALSDPRGSILASPN